MNQSNLNLASKSTGPVECLGQKFPSEEARREHYLNLLAQKLKDPEFRKIEGFPIGKDEDILALSDPPYYTACPNPWLGEFIKGYGTPYDPKQPYHREPFATDVSEGKNHPIYNAHSYHTKVPHRAIMRYILHYTQPGDVVFDGFCGTGMTGVAAQLCGDRAEVQELGYRVQNDGTILNEEGKSFSKLGARRAILNDLAPAASFIAYNYGAPVETDAFEREARRILKETEDEMGWMYETFHSDGKSKGRINYTVWSELFACPECAGEIDFLEEGLDEESQQVKDSINCPHCSAALRKKDLNKALESVFDARLGKTIKQIKRKPGLVNYSVHGVKHEKKPDENDLQILKRIAKLPPSEAIPAIRMMFAPETQESWGDKWRSGTAGFTHTHQVFLARPALALAYIWKKISEIENGRLKSFLRFTFEQGIWGLSLMNRYGPNHFSQVNRAMAGVYYIASQISEVSPWYTFEGKIKRLSKEGFWCSERAKPATQTGSAFDIPIPDKALDYIFVDPPFGDNLAYAELNFLLEAFHRVYTSISSEAIISPTQKKELREYHDLMTRCFAEFYRVLKPGRWITVEFHNTRNSVWNSIRVAMEHAGFVITNVSALDKQQGTFNAVITTTATKQDLIISAYKPNGGLEERFAKRGETEEGVWDFLRTHLKNLPVVKAKGGQLDFIAERDPRILYDRMVAFYVGHSTPVPLSSAEFQAGLAEKYPERDGMVFLPEQVNEYDKKRAQVENIGQLAIFVEDERSAINWLRNFLKNRPSTYQDTQPEFMQQLGASWKKWEARPEMSALLDQNFLCYDGTGDVPSQIHAYLSTQFKEFRNLSKDAAQLKNKAKNRWYVPDPKKNVDVETLRNKRLLEEFWSYLPEGYTPPALSANKGQTLPGLTVPRPKIPKGKKLKELRTEAVRVGFKHCYQQKDYVTILVVAEMIPDSVLNEDEQLQMIYDTAVTRSGGGE